MADVSNLTYELQRQLRNTVKPTGPRKIRLKAGIQLQIEVELVIIVVLLFATAWIAFNVLQGLTILGLGTNVKGAVLSIDVEPKTNTLTYDYIIASNRYVDNTDVSRETLRSYPPGSALLVRVMPGRLNWRPIPLTSPTEIIGQVSVWILAPAMTFGSAVAVWLQLDGWLGAYWWLIKFGKTANGVVVAKTKDWLGIQRSVTYRFEPEGVSQGPANPNERQRTAFVSKRLYDGVEKTQAVTIFYFPKLPWLNGAYELGQYELVD